MLRKIAIFLIFFVMNQAFAVPGIDMGVLIEQLATLKKQITELKSVQNNLKQLKSQASLLSGDQVNALNNILNMNSDNLILSETKSKALQRSIFEQLRLMPYDNAENRALSDRFYRTVSPEDREEISKNLARYQYQPDPPEVVAKKARDLGIESEELINQAVIRYDAYEEKVQLQRRSKLENEESEERSKSIQDFENTIHKLGDNSDLATLQLIGHENVSIMRQNEKIIELLKDLLASKESFMSNQASQEAKWQQEEFDRLERLRNRQVSEQVKKELRRTKWERI